MRRGVLVGWHTLSFILAGCLFFFFVLPRWPELAGDVSHTWGTVLRIITGVLLALTALPVVFDLLKSRRPEFGTPQLALGLRQWSIAGHLLAGLLILAAAITEIWVSLETAGAWLFGVYGAAAAIAVLGALSCYLAFAAELPPPPPKPLKAKKAPAPQSVTADPAGDSDATVDADMETDEESVTETEDADEGADGEPETPAETTDDTQRGQGTEGSRRRLRNRRPARTP